MADAADVPDPDADEVRSSEGASSPPDQTAADVTPRQAEEPTQPYPAFTDMLLTETAEGEAEQQLGKYRIEGPLGRGGMGVVFKAFDPDLHRTVAIKVLGGHLRQSPTARRRFLREARAAAAISHPHVLTIHSVEEHDGIPFLVMEYVSGSSLREYVGSRGGLDPLEVIRLGSQISQGLAAAHAQGVIHRDVKPGNVMLDEGATCAQLTDFGLARAAFDNVELTSQDQNVGTPSYMSPESLRGERIDTRSDLFSLGCVLYLMLTGHAPFQGRSAAELIHNILEAEPRKLHEVKPAIPEVLSEVVHQLLEKNPDDRIQTAAEVGDILSRLQQLVNQAPTDEIPNILAAARSRWRRGGNHFAARWLVPVGVCAVVVGVFLLFRRSESPRDQRGGRSQAAAISAEAADNSVDVLEKLDRLIVGHGPEADFDSIAEAVLHANPRAQITVVGPGPFNDAVELTGDDVSGLQLIAEPRAIWRCPDRNNHRTLSVSDCENVTIRGFDFEVDETAGRALQLRGDARDITIADCSFRQTLPEHSLSLVQVVTSPRDNASVVTIRGCRFETTEGPMMCLAVGEPESAARVVCEACQFLGPNNLVYLNDGCRQMTLSHNIFLDGSIGINVSYKEWYPDTRLEVINNTFLDCRYWFGLMDSFRSGSLPYGQEVSRVCNNLILGGHRVQGGEDQWGHALDAWTFAANWWERDASTLPDATKGDRLATLHNRLPVFERNELDDPEFLRPAADSPLWTSGAGGDLPVYIGAQAPNRE